MTERSKVLLLLEPVENAALMFEEKLDGADPTGTSTITNELLKMLTGSIRALSEEMRRE